MAKFDFHISKTVQPILTKLRTSELSPEDHPACKTTDRYDNMGGLGEHPVCHAL